MKNVLIITTVVIVFVFIGGLGYLRFVLPNVGTVPDIKVVRSSERILRGEYLANHVMACMDCHSTRDWTRFSGPLKTGTLGKGGEYFGPEMGFPGKYYSRNLTPTNLGNWTDGEIFRAITSGVDNKDEALFPVMPYPYYAHLDREDVMDIIAYLRSLSDIDTEVPQSISDFPMSLIINTMPLKPSFTKRPAKEDTVQYGGYLVNAAACMDCHTPVNKGQIILENAFSGGREFEMQGGTLRSSNITPDVETGIGSWTEDIFVSKFKAFVNPEDLPTVESRDYNTLMPWSMYAGMDTTDIKAIYAYLKTLKPIQNEVV
jgi:mono/diheme cytochrome c family protein